jgi:2-amino-4-hydroxy-6-hydroxymethyldihydropteridine diphosphokinase
MREAVARLDAVASVRVVARSRFYETAPVDVLDQPEFLNAAVLVACSLRPSLLLDELLRIERELGRTRGADEIRFGPRRIDLDVLWIDGIAVDDVRLTVPHPRLARRAFALLPMLEVAPDAKDPRTGEAYVVPDDAGVRVTSSTW